MDVLEESSRRHNFRSAIRQRSARRQFCSGLRRILQQNTKDFCTNTTLHGLKYVVDSNLQFKERLFFAISFFVVVIVSLFFISNVYSKWRSTPVILSLSPIPTVISEVPFPAVTICNLNQAMKSKVKHLNRKSIEYAMLQTICHREVNLSVADTMESWKTLEGFILEISQPCTSMLLECRFGAISYNCSDIFRPIITDAGLCCVFNMVHPKFMYIQNVTNILNISYSDGSEPVDWDPEHGYPKVMPPKFYPRTAAGTGANLGFTVILNLASEEYYCSTANGIGFKVYLHSPTETPNVKDVGLFLAPGMESKLRIRPQKLETDLNIRSMSKKDRRCLFDSEGDLVYFAYYSKRNCELECLTRMTMQNCGCVSYYMPKIYPNASICGIQHTQCVEKYLRIAMLSDRSDDFNDCHDLCWPSCFDLTFDPDLFSIPISNNGFSVEQLLVQNMTNSAVQNIAIAHMFFKENTYRSTKQTEFIGPTDFLSSTGGLMGLFMGFSFISLAEFAYYACFRPYSKMRKRREERRLQSRPWWRRQQRSRKMRKRLDDLYGKQKIHPSAIIPQFDRNGSALTYYGLDVNPWVTKKSQGLL